MLFFGTIIVVGIFTLIGVIQYRAVLSIAFSEVEAKFNSGRLRPPEGVRELFEAAFEDLAALGFDSPVWVLNTEKVGETVFTRLQAALHNPKTGTVAWLSPPTDINRPSFLLMYFTSHLEDGRYAVTQVEDPFFEAVRDEATPAQTVKAAQFTQLLESHEAFVASQGAPVNRTAPRRHIEEFAAPWQQGIRKRLLAAGQLQDEDGIARPSLAFGVRLLIAIYRRPKTASDQQKSYAGRLAALFPIMQRMQHASPARRHEWLLFFASAGLSLVVGTAVFGFKLTAILLGVIAFHEFGHYAAMWAFGYRNIHIAFLPLLGGVTIGHENDPDPAKRAWVSLAGPLPGIIIGWALLAWFLLGNPPLAVAEWLGPLAWILLIVNYLNVLPIPPLDGSHVVRALLPPRFLVLQVLLIAAGIGLAVVLGLVLGLWILAFIALMQLMTVAGIIRIGRTVRAVDSTALNAREVRSLRIRHVLETMERLFGPATSPASRLRQAQEALGLITMRRFSHLHRAVVGVVFAALLVVPVTAISIGTGLVALPSFGLSSIDYEEEVAKYEQRYAKWAHRAREKPIDELIRSLESYGEPPGRPSTESDLARAERRLGSFPDHLAAVYRAANGIPSIGLAPIREIRPVAEDSAARRLLSDGQYEGSHYVVLSNGTEYSGIEIPHESTRNWWVLGPEQFENRQLFWAPNGLPDHPEYQVIEYFIESPTAYRGLDSLVEMTWVQQAIDAEILAD